MFAWLFSREFAAQEGRIKEAVDEIDWAAQNVANILNRVGQNSGIDWIKGEGVSLDVECALESLARARLALKRPD